MNKQNTKVIIINNRINKKCVPLDTRCNWKNTTSHMTFLLKMHNKSNHEEALDNPRLEAILQNNWLVTFKSVKVTKERLKNYTRLKVTNET